MRNNYSEDCKTIREYFGLTQEELAGQIGTTRVSIARLENDSNAPSMALLEAVYSFAFDNGMDPNKNHADIMEDDRGDKVLLFHGSKNVIREPISFLHSKGTNDFGIGFYAGETYSQAATFISTFRSNYVYALYLDLKGLKIYELSADKEWMLAISYFRGRIKDYEDHPMIQKIIKRIKECDVIIAPIADNSMYETLNEFSAGEITDEQTRHAIRANYLGRQYVFLSEKAISSIKDLTEMYVSESEKNHYKKMRMEQLEASKNKTELAKINFRRKGKYIDELLD